MRERVDQLLGTSGARRTGIAIAAIVAVAVIALIVLLPAGDANPDAYTTAADRLCLKAKQRIVGVKRRYGSSPDRADTQSFAQSLVPIVGSLRAQLEKLTTPSDRLEQAVEIENTMLQSEAELIHLARFVDPGNEEKVLASARLTRAISAKVENEASSLGLTQCTRLEFGVSPRL